MRHPSAITEEVSVIAAVDATDLKGARRRLDASSVRAAGEAGRQVGDAVGAAHGADGRGEAVAVTDALSFWGLASNQGPAQR